jgi:hypothetical protein
MICNIAETIAQLSAAWALEPGDLIYTGTPEGVSAVVRGEVVRFPFAGRHVGYSDLVETRAARGTMFGGPVRSGSVLNHPLLEGETPSAYQRVAVAADSGNGISAILDYQAYSFVNSDLTINLLRQPVGEWMCLDARTHLGSNGCGVAESALYDEQGFDRSGHTKPGRAPTLTSLPCFATPSNIANNAAPPWFTACRMTVTPRSARCVRPATPCTTRIRLTWWERFPLLG